MREFLENNNEIGLFVVVIGGVESVMTTEELMEIVENVKVEFVGREKLVGKIFDVSLEVEVV